MAARKIEAFLMSSRAARLRQQLKPPPFDGLLYRKE